MSDSHLKNSKGSRTLAGQMNERIELVQIKLPELIRARDVLVFPWARGVPYIRVIRADFSWTQFKTAASRGEKTLGGRSWKVAQNAQG